VNGHHTDASAGAAIAKLGVERDGFGAVAHAAGITRDKTLSKMGLAEHWQPVIDVNLKAVADIDAALLSTPRALRPASVGGCGFVSYGSTSGVAGNFGQTNYGASKAGLMGYAKAMGTTSDHRFFVVAPGFIVTEMTKKVPFLQRTIGARLNALGQGGLPEDVAHAVAFLSSHAAAGLAPGSVLRVCGLFMGGR